MTKVLKQWCWRLLFVESSLITTRLATASNELPLRSKEPGCIFEKVSGEPVHMAFSTMHEAVPEISALEQSFRRFLKTLPANPKKRHLQEVKASAKLALRELTLLHKVSEGSILMKDRATDGIVVLGQEFYDRFLSGLRGRGVRFDKSGWMRNGAEGYAPYCEVLEASVMAERLSYIQKGEWQGAYRDKWGYLVVAGLEPLQQKKQTGRITLSLIYPGHKTPHTTNVEVSR